MLKENNRVLVSGKVVPGPELVFGRVYRVFPTFDDNETIIVKLDNGNLLKCKAEDVTLVTEDPTKPDEITISREDFKNAVVKVTNPKEYDVDYETSIAIALTGILIGKKLERELFDE